jgi:hypothetical protein
MKLSSGVLTWTWWYWSVCLISFYEINCYSKC